jgi:ribonuclease T1
MRPVTRSRTALATLLAAAALGGAQAAARERGRAREAARASGLPAVRARELPTEAQKTLALIARGGPFPHRRDGAVFSNRERRLPSRPGGYYHEYTVPTPGARDRGARRVIAGARGERYYTSDHYRSFRRIEE